MVFLIGEHSYNKKVPISVHFFTSSRCMIIVILVGKVILLVQIKSALIMSLPAQTINKTPLNNFLALWKFFLQGLKDCEYRKNNECKFFILGPGFSLPRCINTTHTSDYDLYNTLIQTGCQKDRCVD